MEHPYPLAGTLPGRLVLASGSPRRRELLALLNIAFEVVPADVDETPGPDESPRELVERLAALKALAVSAARPDDVVVGADTIVDVDGEVFGKPAGEADARRMLLALSGRAHLVHTGVAVAVGGDVRARGTATTEVVVVELTNAVIDWYVGSGEPLDKAGAYALQGHGGVLVAAVNGSASSVVGLPLDLVVTVLASLSTGLR